MEKNREENYNNIKTLLKRKKQQAFVIALLGAVVVFCALVYLTFGAGLPLGASSWSILTKAIVVLVLIAFSASALVFVRQYLFKWFVEEIETIHYKDKDYIETAERIYKELK